MSESEAAFYYSKTSITVLVKCRHSNNNMAETLNIKAIKHHALQGALRRDGRTACCGSGPSALSEQTNRRLRLVPGVHSSQLLQ